jgi:hypothetical protein
MRAGKLGKYNNRTSEKPTDYPQMWESRANYARFLSLVAHVSTLPVAKCRKSRQKLTCLLCPIDTRQEQKNSCVRAPARQLT